MKPLKALFTTAILLCFLFGASLGHFLPSFPRHFPADYPIGPDADRNATQLIESRGFKAELHHVETDDGYILQLHRIINPQVSKTIRPVIVQHGLESSSDDWLTNSNEDEFKQVFNSIDELEATNNGSKYHNSIPFELALKGYDVWLSNSRGNKYGLGHTKLTPWNPQFWKFSFDEMIKYDIPAVIAYVQKATGVKTLAYIGHSQGTMVMFGLLSTRPEYSQIIKPFIAMAPVTTVGHIKTPIRYLSQAPIREALKLIGGEFTLPKPLAKLLADKFCDKEIIDKAICENVAFLLSGFDEKNLDPAKVPIYLHHFPAGTSSWNIVHFAQGVSTRKFRMFDYGPLENWKKYKQIHPPEYPLEKINSTDMILIWSQNDWLADPVDIAILRDRLMVPIIEYEVTEREYNHLDFITAKDAGEMVVPQLMQELIRYN